MFVGVTFVVGCVALSCVYARLFWAICWWLVCFAECVVGFGFLVCLLGGVCVCLLCAY